MTERQWELYRLSAMKEAADSPLKAAVIRAIEYKLTLLDRDEKASMQERDGLPPFHGLGS